MIVPTGLSTLAVLHFLYIVGMSHMDHVITHRMMPRHDTRKLGYWSILATVIHELQGITLILSDGGGYALVTVHGMTVYRCVRSVLESLPV